MKISYHTVSSNNTTSNGYGYAGSNIMRSLRKLGHSVEFTNGDLPVQLNFVQPTYYRFYPNQYQIGYTPWESSGLPDRWIDKLNAVDEVWTTSDTCAKWFKRAGVKGDIKVFHHGVEPLWKPKKRSSNGVLKFLHVGEPSPRKGGQIALEAFRAAFGGSRDYHLTLKCTEHNTTRIYDGPDRGAGRSIIGTPASLPNVSIITETLKIDELVSLYHSHHVMVYPSWGEGFGFIPLQALATGMPTICTEAWAPYRDFLGDLALESQPWDSPWPNIHPGDMFKPDFDHLVTLFRSVAEERDTMFKKFYEAAPAVHEAFNWMTLTENAFRHLENK